MDGGSGANGSIATAPAGSIGRSRGNGSERLTRLTRFLSQIPLFQDLDEASLQQLARQARVQRYRGRSLASRPLEKGDGLSLVMGGAFKVCTPSHQGRDAILSLLGPGDFFGEFCVLPGRPGNVRVIALRRSDVATLPTDVFAALLSDHPEVMMSLLRATADRIRRAEVAACLLLSMSSCGPLQETTESASGEAPSFHSIGARAGLTAVNVSGGPEQVYILETMSAGAAFADVDGDGYQDLFLVNGTRHDTVVDSHHRLYRNEPLQPPQGVQTRRFVDISAAAGVDDRGWGMGAAAGDVDNDGAPDLLATHWGSDRFYRNRGRANFDERSQASGLSDPGWGSSAAFADLDADGYLDLYVARYLEFDLDRPPGGKGRNCHYKGLEVFCGPKYVPPMSDRLYRNVGDGTFADVSTTTGIESVELPALGVAYLDLEADGDLDIYVANDSEPNLLYRNDGAWRFAEVGHAAGVAFTEDGRAQAGMGAHSGDYDNDGDFDLFVTNFSDDTNTLYRNEGGLFAEVTHAAGVGGTARPLLGWGTGFFDYDNDGWLDLFVANGQLYPQLGNPPTGLRYRQPNLLYRNTGAAFERVDGGPAFSTLAVSRAAAIADIDNDGDSDLAIANLNEAPSLLVNDGGDRKAWLGLQLVGDVDVGSNRDAIGARVTVYAAGHAQVREVARGYGFQAAHDPRLRFGLGPATRVDSVRIRWPSGAVQLLTASLPLRRYVRVIEAGEVAVLEAAPRAPGEEPPAAAATSDPVPLPYELPAEVTTAEAAYAVGKQLYEEGRYGDAEGAFRAGLVLDESDLSSRVNLAVTLFMGVGDRAAASAELQRAVVDHPKRYEPRLWLGKLELHGGQVDSAIVHLRRAVSLHPLDWDSYHWLGIALLRADSLEAGRTALERSVKLGPYHPRPHLALARALHRLGREPEAVGRRQTFRRLSALQTRVEEYELRVDTDPAKARDLTNLASAYAEQRRWAPAEARFREAVALDPGYARAHYGLGVILHRLKRSAESIAAFSAACGADSSFVEAFNGLGQAYQQARDHERAIDAYEQAIRLRPDLVPARANLGLVHYASGRSQAALQTWRRALQLAPQDARLSRWIEKVEAEIASAE